MTLRPEQQRALDYVRRRGSEATLDSIRQRVATTYQAIEELVTPVGSSVAAARPGPPSSWSIHEVVDHLVESDRRAVLQLAELLAGRPVAEEIPAGLQSARPFERDWSTLRFDFVAVHRHLLTVLDGARDDVPLAATAPVEMVVKCACPDGGLVPVHWRQRFDWKAYAILVHAHNREHVEQIRRLLAAAGPTAPGERT